MLAEKAPGIAQVVSKIDLKQLDIGAIWERIREAADFVLEGVKDLGR